MHDVVGQTCPQQFAPCLYHSPYPELSQTQFIFDPGVWKFRYRTPFSVARLILLRFIFLRKAATSACSSSRIRPSGRVVASGGSIEFDSGRPRNPSLPPDTAGRDLPAFGFSATPPTDIPPGTPNSPRCPECETPPARIRRRYPATSSPPHSVLWGPASTPPDRCFALRTR